MVEMMSSADKCKIDTISNNYREAVACRGERALAERLDDARELFVKHCIPRANALRFVDGMVIPCVVRSCRGDRKGRRRR